jgi:signal transduction histidine kinase/CheY-like chemotaxis protein
VLYKLEIRGASGLSFVCRNEWINPESGLETFLGDSIEVKEPMTSFIRQQHVNIDDDLYFRSEDLPFGDMINSKRQHLENYIVAPIFIKKELTSIVVFGRNYEQEFSESDADLAILVASVFSSVFELNTIEHDLNDVLKLKSELIEAKMIAEQSSSAKSEFLSRMSHEMRTPMTAVMGMAQVAQFQSRQGNYEDLDSCFDEIEKASNEMMNLINDVLDVADMEYGIVKLVEADFNFNSMVDEVSEYVSCNASKKHQTFNSDIDSQIPGILAGDEKKLKQAITNLLRNAVKFTPEKGEINLKINMLGEDDEKVTLQIEVSDNGIGISKEQQKELFGIFEQADGSNSRTHGGVGVGLALSKRIIEMMDGEIKVESESNKGTKFVFTCKLKKCDSRLYSSKGKSLSGKIILIAEDIVINREIVKCILEETGAEIIEAENGKEAIDLLNQQKGKVDLILMDISMPVMNGYEAARQIRNSGLPNAADIPILAVTAHTSSEDIDAATEAGMNFLLGKPFEPQKLIEAIRRYL